MKKSDPRRVTGLRNSWSVKLIGISFWGQHQTPVTWRNPLKQCSHILHTLWRYLYHPSATATQSIQVRREWTQAVGDKLHQRWNWKCLGRAWFSWMNDTLQFVTNAPKRRKKKTGNLDMQAGKQLQLECGRKFPHLSKITSTPLWSLLLSPLEYYKHKQCRDKFSGEGVGWHTWLFNTPRVALLDSVVV